MLVGPNLANGDYEVLELVKAAGGEIVVEEICEGIRYYWHEIDNQGDEAYQTFIGLGYSGDDIYYLNPDDTRANVDIVTTKDKVRNAIINWLYSSSDRDDIIFIYFVDHGDWDPENSRHFFSVLNKDIYD